MKRSEFNSSRQLMLLLFLVVAQTGIVSAQEDQFGPLAVPADVTHELLLPGRSNQLLRPSAIFIDRHFNECLISDPGHNRVVIFDSSGIFRFEFSGNDLFSTPGDLAVDSDGQIYVVGSTEEGKRLFLFDYDGLFLRELELFTADSSRVTIGSMTVDDSDRILVQDLETHSILLFDRSTTLVDEISLDDRFQERTLREMVYGRITAEQGRILLPLSTLGTVLVYSADGRFLRSLGYKGNRVGEMSFPVSAALTSDATFIILDKNSHNVICYDSDYTFGGEFGGRGFHRGWFYHPTLLAVDGEGRIFIGQILDNRVQVCSLPISIVDRIASRSGSEFRLGK